MCGANQHFLRLPTSLFGRSGFGEVGHLPPDPDGVDETNDNSSLTPLEGNRPDMQRIMNVIGFP
jgi:hypothetical protein